MRSLSRSGLWYLFVTCVVVALLVLERIEEGIFTRLFVGILFVAVIGMSGSLLSMDHEDRRHAFILSLLSISYYGLLEGHRLEILDSGAPANRVVWELLGEVFLPLADRILVVFGPISLLYAASSARRRYRKMSTAPEERVLD